MKCIVGLGNPGRKYKNTRHNIGFLVVEELLRRHQWKLDQKKFNGNYTLENFQGQKVILLEPQTFMNVSGESIKPLIDYYHIDLDDVLVIYDDLDLPVGKIRLREKGGHGGHNGIRSTIEHLGTKEFKRLRVGIGRPVGPMAVVDYVLGKFDKEQTEEVNLSIQNAADACESWLTRSFVDAMNQFNV